MWYRHLLSLLGFTGSMTAFSLPALAIEMLLLWPFRCSARRVNCRDSRGDWVAWFKALLGPVESPFRARVNSCEGNAFRRTYIVHCGYTFVSCTITDEAHFYVVWFLCFREGIWHTWSKHFFFFLPSMSLELCIFVDYRKKCFFSSIKQDILLKLLVIFTLVNTFCW